MCAGYTQALKGLRKERKDISLYYMVEEDSAGSEWSFIVSLLSRYLTLKEWSYVL